MIRSKLDWSIEIKWSESIKKSALGVRKDYFGSARGKNIYRFSRIILSCSDVNKKKCTSEYSNLICSDLTSFISKKCKKVSLENYNVFWAVQVNFFNIYKMHIKIRLGYFHIVLTWSIVFIMWKWAKFSKFSSIILSILSDWSHLIIWPI